MVLGAQVEHGTIGTPKAKGLPMRRDARTKDLFAYDDGRIFHGINAAAQAIGCRTDSLTRALNGRRASILGFRFAYLEETS